MDYDRVINATYSWLSLKKVGWFLVFFWLLVPLLFIIPWALEKQYFDESVSWIVYVLYIISYVGVVVGFVTLNCACLSNRKLKAKSPTKKSLIDTGGLVLFELWHIFVWNIHISYRFTQILLLVGAPLLYLYYLFNPTSLILGSLSIFVLLYLLMVIYNTVRLFFTLTVFYNKNLSIKEAVRESWQLTSGKFTLTFFSIALVVGVVFVMFAVMAIVVGALAHIVLLPHFTPLVAYELAQTVAIMFALGPAILGYYFGAIEVYTQLNREQESSSRIKRILAKRILSPQRKKTVKRKKKIKRKAKNKKVVKKKKIKAKKK